ncbi:MAG: hypothetical protein Q8K45_00725 [Rubrivivax sp.]|nr:hypothetical protein [Rubrivivax sp.]
MKTSSDQAAAKRASQRRLAGVAGVMVGSVAIAAVTVLFDSASRMPWLAPTEANAALLARCDRIAGTAARHHCVEAVIAAVQARGSDVRLAARGPPATSPIAR